MPSSSSLKQLHLSLRRGDATALRQLLARHSDAREAINEPIFGFDAPAIVAVGNDINLVTVLLEFGADPNQRSEWWAGGFHALHGARGDVADKLLAAGAVPDACAAANLDRVDLLERMIADDRSRVNERGGDGKTPLHFARSQRVVDVLLSNGADINARDVDHRSTAAEWMLGSDPDEARLDLARYLVDRGSHADIFLCAALGLTDRARTLLGNNRDLLSLRVGQGEYGEKPPSSFHIYQWTIGSNLTPLQTASKFGRIEAMRAMLEFASAVEKLMLACHRAEREIALDIVAANPGIIETLGAEDQRALTDEAWAPNAPAVKLMMELGFDPGAESVSGPTGGTALHCAAWEGSAECVAAILEYPRGRALLEARDRNYNGTPLSWCSHGSTNCGNVKADHAAVARLLIDAGAVVTPEMANWEGSGAFMMVIRETLDRAG